MIATRSRITQSSSSVPVSTLVSVLMFPPVRCSYLLRHSGMVHKH
jgi:hypothetical protein